MDESLSSLGASWHSSTHHSHGSFSHHHGNDESFVVGISEACVTPPRSTKLVELDSPTPTDATSVSSSTCSTPRRNSTLSSSGSTTPDTNNKVITKYEDVRYHGKTGSLVLTPTLIVFKSKGKRSWRWSSIQKHQVSVASSKVHRIKFVSNVDANKAVTFELLDRKQLETVRQDVVERLATHQKKARRNTLATSVVAPPVLEDFLAKKAQKEAQVRIAETKAQIEIAHLAVVAEEKRLAEEAKKAELKWVAKEASKISQDEALIAEKALPTVEAEQDLVQGNLEQTERASWFPELAEKQIDEEASATIIAACWRSFSASNAYQLQKKAAIQTQTVWRGLLATRAVNALVAAKEEEEASAAIIALQWRTFSAANLYKGQKEAAVKIQGARRKQLATRVLQALKTAREEDAATIMASHWRSFSATKAYHHQHEAATKIQRSWRGLLATRVLNASMAAKEEESAVIIASHWRPFSAVKAYQHQKEAAVKIQSVRRQQVAAGVLTALMTARAETSATIIASKWRSFSAGRTHKNQQEAAVKIQTMGRMHLARRALNALRSNNRKEDEPQRELSIEYATEGNRQCTQRAGVGGSGVRRSGRT